MDQPQVGRLMVDILKKSTIFMVRFAKGHAIPLIGSAVVVLLGWQAWRAYHEFRRQEVTFLIGASSGSSVEDARRIKEQVEDGEATLVGNSYSLHLTPTSGYEENRKRIKEDEEGRLVGFAYDGFGDAEDSEKVAIVLPLDKRYLHILCRKDFLRGLQNEAQRLASWASKVVSLQKDEDSPVRKDFSLKRIYDALGPGRVYLGTPESATRQCAEIVLKHFGVDPEKVRCHGVGGFEEMRAALNRGHIDVAFSSGLFNSEEILSIAGDKNCVLLGLNGERDAIVQEHPHLLPVNFQPNSYLSGDFCPERLETIGARRVLICSNQMSPKDAYVMGMSTLRGLRDRMPEIEWESSPPGMARTEPTPLRYQLHPGAELIRYDQQPSGQFQWLQVFLATVAVWGFAESLRFLNSLFPTNEKGQDSHNAVTGQDEDDQGKAVQESASSAAGHDNDSHNVYGTLKVELDQQVSQLEHASIPLSRQAHADWQHEIDKLRERVLEANRSGNLSRKRTHILLEGLEKELMSELNIRRPAKRKRARDSA